MRTWAEVLNTPPLVRLKMGEAVKAYILNQIIEQGMEDYTGYNEVYIDYPAFYTCNYREDCEDDNEYSIYTQLFIKDEYWCLEEFFL